MHAFIDVCRMNKFPQDTKHQQSRQISSKRKKRRDQKNRIDTIFSHITQSTVSIEPRQSSNTQHNTQHTHKMYICAHAFIIISMRWRGTL